jgi:hypothetical protein
LSKPRSTWTERQCGIVRPVDACFGLFRRMPIMDVSNMRDDLFNRFIADLKRDLAREGFGFNGNGRLVAKYGGEPLVLTESNHARHDDEPVLIQDVILEIRRGDKSWHVFDRKLTANNRAQYRLKSSDSMGVLFCQEVPELISSSVYDALPEHENDLYLRIGPSSMWRNEFCHVAMESHLNVVSDIALRAYDII